MHGGVFLVSKLICQNAIRLELLNVAPGGRFFVTLNFLWPPGGFLWPLGVYYCNLSVFERGQNDDAMSQTLGTIVGGSIRLWNVFRGRDW